MIKRLLDLILVLGSAPLWVPVGLITAFVVAVKLGRPVLFIQTRAGLFGEPFRIYKFRTMTDARDADGELLPAEQRLTPFGRKLRQTSLDEIPQLLNVLIGDMSLVGPRPLLPEYNDRYNEDQRRRLYVRPGVSGWAQVKGRNRLSWEERFALDIEYVNNVNLWFDLKIILMTLSLMLRRGGGVEPEGAAIMEEFRETKSMQIETGTEQLLCEIRDGVAIITLNRPEARNALSDFLSPALRKMIKQMGEDDSVGAILITGAGTAFCAGGDVKGMAGRSNKAPMTTEEKIADLKVRQRTLTGAIVTSPKPVIAALPGPAAGAGMAIALACDIRFASDTAFVATGYARVGLTGDYGISWLLTRLVGTARARELMYTGEKVDAARCERLGIFNHVVPFDELFDRAFAFAKQLADGPRQALSGIKANLDRAAHAEFLAALDQEAEILVPTAQTADHKEAVAAFVEKRKPVFGKG